MPEVFHEADFIVVGAGSAGSLLAARLAEGGKHKVAVIEAGPPGRDPLLSVPLLTGWLLRGRWLMTAVQPARLAISIAAKVSVSVPIWLILMRIPVSFSKLAIVSSAM